MQTYELPYLLPFWYVSYSMIGDLWEPFLHLQSVAHIDFKNVLLSAMHLMSPFRALSISKLKNVQTIHLLFHCEYIFYFTTILENSTYLQTSYKLVGMQNIGKLWSSTCRYSPTAIPVYEQIKTQSNVWKIILSMYTI